MRILLLLALLLALIPPVAAQEDVSKEDALKAIDDARADVQEMEEQGIGTAFVNDVLGDAENALSNRNYQQVLEKTEAISDRQERAFEIMDSIRALELRIDEVSGIGDPSKAEERLSEANAAFKNENYGEAEDAVFDGERYLQQVEGEYSIVKARYSAARDNTVSYVKEHWKTLVLSILLIFAVIAVSYLRISRMKNMKMLENMRIKRKVLDDLIKKAQMDYFNEAKISRRVYEMKMRKYREKMLELEEKIPILESQFGDY